MRVIKSIETTDAILTYSNILENEYPNWGDGAGDSVYYPSGARVIYQHRIYEKIVTGSSLIPPNIDQDNWLDVGATNKYRMFDNIISSVSSRVGGIQFTLTPNQVVNSIALINVNASTVRVVMTDPVDGVVYDQTKELRTVGEVTDYFSYFFAPLVSLTDLNTAIFLDLPSRPTATITVYISSGAALVEVGEVVYGIQSVVGRTNYNTSFGLKSFSKKEVDEFGKVTVVKRKNSKYCEYDIDIDNVNLTYVQRLFQDIDSVPCLFVGNPDMEHLIVYGFYSDFKSTITFPTVSKCTLRVEGLI